jgi:hypothetical protein
MKIDNLMVKKPTVNTVFGMIFMILFAGGCAGWFAEPDPNLGSQNAALATKIKTEFIKNPELNAAPISVEVSEGVVHLKGFVETETKKQQATVVAQNVSGVTEVVNEIEVK